MTGKDHARLQKIRTVLTMAAFAIILIAYAHFHAQLKRLVDAGFAARIMFGSDQNGVAPDDRTRARHDSVG